MRDRTECVPVFGTPDHRTIVSGRSSCVRDSTECVPVFLAQTTQILSPDVPVAVVSTSAKVRKPAFPGWIVTAKPSLRVRKQGRGLESKFSSSTGYQEVHNHKCARLRRLRWANLDNEEATSKAEVARLLTVLILPRLFDSEGRKECVFEAWPEYLEVNDFC